MFRKVKQERFDLGQRRCGYCCRQLVWQSGQKNSATIEHIVTRHAGGTDHRFNILVICKECNSYRGNQNFIDFLKKQQPPRIEWLVGKYLTAVHNTPSSTVSSKDKKTANRIAKGSQDIKKWISTWQLKSFAKTA